MGMIVALCGVLGLTVGSFLNVVIYRVPAGKSVVRPASACPHCGSGIRPRDNIPVLSWLILRGKCRDCGAPISARYPLIEFMTGLFFVAVAWWALDRGAGHPAATVLVLVAFLWLAAASIALTAIDLDVQRLPNVIVLPGYAVGTALLGAAALVDGRYDQLLTAAIGGAALFAMYLIMVLVYPGGMGLGDVKLAGVLGIFLGWLGWDALAVGGFAPFVLGGLFALVLIVLRRAGRKTKMPFGPWMLAGAWVGIFGGRAIAG